MIPIKYSFQLIGVLFSITIVGCDKNDNVIPNYYISKGCIPAKITLIDNNLGGYEDTYVYNNELLESFGVFDYKYSNGFVEQTSILPDRYEKYYYDGPHKIIRSVQYRRDSPAEGFKVVSDIEYTYKNQILTMATDYAHKEYYLLYYPDNSKNLDSLKTFKENGELIKKEVFEYDTFNSIYKNLRTPKFNYFSNLRNETNNNIKKLTIIFYNNNSDSTIFYYDYSYNNFGYPTEIIISTNKSSMPYIKLISYLNCEK